MGELKILHLCSARQYVGEAAWVVDAVDYLIQRGHEAEIICRDGYSVADAAVRRKIPYTAATMDSRCTFYHDILDIRTIRRRIREFQPDLLHAHRGKDHWLAALALRGFSSSIPLIRTRHVVTSIKDHYANRWLFGKATQGLICVSQAVRAEVAKSESLLHSPIRTICGGVNPATHGEASPAEVESFCRRYHIPAGAPVISCLARLAPVKGQEYILRAIPAVLRHHPRAIFLFVFPRKSEYAEHLFRIARELGVTESVRWIGNLPGLAPFFAATDIGLLASVGSEGWSRATAEFLYNRIPVVASRVGCLSELIFDEVNGYLVEKRNADEMGLRINALLNHPERAESMGLEGEKMVREHFTFSHTVDKLERFYHEVLENARQPGRAGKKRFVLPKKKG